MPADGATDSVGASTGLSVGVAFLSGDNVTDEAEGDIDGNDVGAADGAELGLVVGTPDDVADDGVDDGADDDAELGLVVGTTDGVGDDGA